MSSPTLHVVLYQPGIPANAGAIGRTCLALGAKLWLVRPLGFQTGDRQLRRAGLDYWQHLAWEAADDWEDLLPAIARARSHAVAAVQGGRPAGIVEARFAQGDVLVFGSETQGLPPSLRDAYPGRALSIPMRPPARSLNLWSAWELWPTRRGGNAGRSGKAAASVIRAGA